MIKRLDWAVFKMPFGKHKGDTLYHVYLNDPKYLLWMADNVQQMRHNLYLKKAIDRLGRNFPGIVAEYEEKRKGGIKNYDY